MSGAQDAAGVLDPGSAFVTDEDLARFHAGTHRRLHEVLGARPVQHEGRDAVFFGVWAPNASSVHVIGDFNGWAPEAHPLHRREGSGIWQGIVPGAGLGTRYKFRVAGPGGHAGVDRADPLARQAEPPPGTASVVAEPAHPWGDEAWLARRAATDWQAAPMTIYEVHLGSWRRVPEEGNRALGYREIAPLLAGYAAEHGFTHVELLPVMEHPFYGSWGYQTTGYFAPTARYGPPEDLMFLVDTLHRAGIGVLLDWVPSHFPDDPHALALFDGTPLYEHADPREGRHPDWDSLIFDYGRGEVRSFLLSSAIAWIERYHGDGLRVDAVASMLYRDYSRAPSEWIPNVHGGRENLEAIGFLRDLTSAVAEEQPGVLTIAEESTAWPLVSRPVDEGGLGFSFKWDMGWMHDTLQFLARDPIHRRHHHDELTFRAIYALHESFVLPLSHDEVVHGKGSLLQRMPGDDWQRLANLRLLLGYQATLPGKTLLFMGGELGQWGEWSHEASLDWHLADDPRHAGIRRWVGHLNRTVAGAPALHELDTRPGGFAWVDAGDRDRGTLSWLRTAATSSETVLVACNLTPVPRENVRLGVPHGGRWEEIANSDAAEFGGGGWGNLGGVEAAPVPAHGRARSIVVTLPALAVVVLRSPGR